MNSYLNLLEPECIKVIGLFTVSDLEIKGEYDVIVNKF